jgi:hypothetical protein
MSDPVRQKALTCFANTPFGLCEFPFQVCVFVERFAFTFNEAGMVAYGFKIQVSQSATLFAMAC